MVLSPDSAFSYPQKCCIQSLCTSEMEPTEERGEKRKKKLEKRDYEGSDGAKIHEVRWVQSSPNNMHIHEKE